MCQQILGGVHDGIHLSHDFHRVDLAIRLVHDLKHLTRID